MHMSVSGIQAVKGQKYRGSLPTAVCLKCHSQSASQMSLACAYGMTGMKKDQGRSEGEKRKGWMKNKSSHIVCQSLSIK